MALKKTAEKIIIAYPAYIEVNTFIGLIACLFFDIIRIANGVNRNIIKGIETSTHSSSCLGLSFITNKRYNIDNTKHAIIKQHFRTQFISLSSITTLEEVNQFLTFFHGEYQRFIKLGVK